MMPYPKGTWAVLLQTFGGGTNTVTLFRMGVDLDTTFINFQT
ncbi:hypothetical protein GGE12_004494 [Rhizobium mongolense]|uniref:Uncharacterized protein n=1 Tax=Rhizobium mongolense TaxID=57676 RepID=A0A7W6WFN7_9HYPH|nr:hypothetical protein [Rhizobium mongolense]